MAVPPDQTKKTKKKQKYYAVRHGISTGIFRTWAECRANVHGVANAQYKSFESEEEALHYLEMGGIHTAGTGAGSAPGASAAAGADPGSSEPGTSATADADPNTALLTAYVDGSYEHALRRYSYGCVFLLPDGNVIRDCGSGTHPEAAALRNVTGELLGAAAAVKFALLNGYQSLRICYDYQGIELWATDGWKANKDLTRAYRNFMQKHMEHLQISFQKIAAHTGVEWNEEADRLAKSALLEDYALMPDPVPEP